MNTVYLDYAAATPLDPIVLASMQPFLTDNFYNPSAQYSLARQTHTALQAARAEVAAVLGSRPSEILFTAGGTEANNLAIHGVLRRHPEASIIVSSIEHAAVLEPAAQYKCTLAPVTLDGITDIAALEHLIDATTVLVSIMYANNEIGTVQPIRQIGQLLAGIRKERLRAGNNLPLYFHTDACQAANYLDLHVSRLGVDLLTLNGSKLYGPKQTGALYVRGGIVLEPLIYGGGQEHGLRSGTENVAGVVGFATALSQAQQLRQGETGRLQALQKEFFKRLHEALPAATINGSLRQRLPNNVHITIPGTDNERVLMALDEAGIMAAAGSACSASSAKASTVLESLGLSESAARSSLRFSMGRQTTLQDVVLAVEKLQTVVD